MKYSLLIIMFLSILVAAGGAGPPAVDGKKAAKATPGKNTKPAAAKNDLIGVWFGIRAEYDGEQPLNNDLVRSSYAIVEADRIFVFVEGKRYGPVFYRLNQSVKPHQIDLWCTTPEGEFHRAEGIYRIQDDKIWMSGRADDRRPTSFKTWAGSKVGLAIGQRRSR